MAYAVESTTLFMAQGDDKRFRFNVVGSDGVAIDISASSEISFVVANRVNGTVVISKTMSGGGILIGVNSQFYLDISNTESGTLAAGQNYFEAQITSSSGAKQTVAVGLFIVQDTIIGD